MNKKQAIKSHEFRIANGHVLRTINILRTKYNKLQTVESVVKGYGVQSGAFADAVNFLSVEGYLHLRLIENRDSIDVADVASLKLVEGKLTGKGIRLLAGGIVDDMIEV